MLVDNRASAPDFRPARVAGAHCTCSPTPPTSITALSEAIATTTPRTLAIIVGLRGGRSSSGSSFAGGGGGQGGGLDAGPGATAPDVADGQGQGVGGVGGPGRGVEPEQPGDHAGDLRLAGGPGPGDGGLDLAGR